MNYEKVLKRAYDELEYAQRINCFAMLDTITLELLLEYIECLKKR